MSYSDFVEMKDYQGRSIELSDNSWEHIQETHPEITREDIRQVLADPLEVREYLRRTFLPNENSSRGENKVSRGRREDLEKWYLCLNSYDH
jgi:hypothetical protein